MVQRHGLCPTAESPVGWCLLYAELHLQSGRGVQDYLAFQNSLHPDYITEKPWRNTLDAGAVPVVMGPSRRNYEQFLPPDAFIHVSDFQSPKELAQYLLALDKDHARYLSYFHWRESWRPQTFSWALMFCKACWRLQQESTYQTVPSIASWFT
ncbi:4-galactosyl-N-acetylglucosaminide 3-alpha-L-fucosyltransferase FUT5 [Ursus arctos]|uniref:4-galactosyl-N-acetylglucosaminide 3-alpha-L-fucosyltransferase FUT5 n=1 Tax=Ursus arctos TaxID=9644 RepID=UPI002548EB5C|nr:4-galactosyl-N-acetylglucosaminide 3-alpha-L-fucosyltransferase FUT5 [Ursus arctos]